MVVLVTSEILSAPCHHPEGNRDELIALPTQSRVAPSIHSLGHTPRTALGLTIIHDPAQLAITLLAVGRRC